MVDSENQDPHHQDAPHDSETTSHFTAEFEAQLANLDGAVSAEEQEAISALPSGSALLGSDFHRLKIVRRSSSRSPVSGVGSSSSCDADSSN